MIVFTLLFSVSVFAQNVLINGHFESGTNKGHFVNGYPEGWEGWGSNGWHHSDSGYKRDNYGIAIWGNDTGCIQVVDAFDYGQFELSGEMICHTTEVLVNKEAILKIEFWDGPHPTGTKLAETLVGVLTTQHTAGTWYTFSDMVTAPVGTREARVICETIATNENSAGKAYWDNISLEAMNTTNSPDYDNSGKVDLLDLVQLASVWCQTSSAHNLIDDNHIDSDDFRIFANAWQATFPGYYLVWSDEFNGPAIDTSAWTHEIGIKGNNEWGWNTNSSNNSYISNGKLVIVAKSDYTTARLTTQWKKTFTYGRVEARIKLPIGGQGIWPAFWMLGESYNWIGWPECGELDIMEAINDLWGIHGTIHYGSTNPYIPQRNGGVHYPQAHPSGDYHTYAIEWDRYQIRWYFDNVKYYESSSWWAQNSAYPAPFNAPFFFILNIAIGGDWPGYPNGSTPFPQQMYVDYVRAYEWRP
jgi:hypothetical protein